MSQYPIDKPRCNCALFGVFGHPAAAQLTYYGLHAQQHRGQEGSGIVTGDFDPEINRNRFYAHRGFGLVSEVFRNPEILTNTLKGSMAVGHNRYSTAGGSDNKSNIQPFTVLYRGGNLAVAHNGNLTNFRSIRKRLQDEGTIFQTTSDTEVILHLVARSKEQDQIRQIRDALNQVEGAYSLLFLTDGKLIAARDPNGFRPLSIGRKENAFFIASETVAFDIIDAEYVREVEPGEMVIIDGNSLATGSLMSEPLVADRRKRRHCVFEYIYFARPDSHIFGHSVDKVRRKLGKTLATTQPVKTKTPDEKPIVINVPDSSNTATIGFVQQTQKEGRPGKIEIGLIRNHYIGRTFIQPGQDIRENKVKTKFNTVRGVLKDRVVVIVDDSIVRGTTSKQLVQLVKQSGAKEVHFRVSSPPIRFPCHYGMDFPTQDELIANACDGDVGKIAKELGVDSLGYLSVEDMLESVPHEGGAEYCTACFNGDYPIPIDREQKKDENEA